MNCRCGAVLYKCEKCGKVMCSRATCPKGNDTRTVGGRYPVCNGPTKAA